MNTKEIKSDVNRIKSEIKQESRQQKSLKDKIKYAQIAYKKFDEIYEKYGQEAYCKYVPEKYRRRDVSSLLKQQRFLSLYAKHGEDTFKKHKTLIMSKDMEYESGNYMKGFMYRMEERLAKLMSWVLASMIVVTPMLEASKIQEKEKMEYSVQIEDYLENIEEFGKKVRTYNFSDIENVMFVTYDMWKNTQGYSEPQINLFSYPGLDLATKEGYGVCRNMADDCANKLNAINEEYNARTITVYMVKGDGELADIERKNNDEETQEENQEETKEETQVEEQVKKVFGNHAVVLFHSIEDDVELVWDPTNPGIGIVMNGEIVMYNASREEPYVFHYTPAGSIIYGIKKVSEIPVNILESIGIYTEEEKSYLAEKYSVESQNKAIQTAIGKNPKSFYETIKVDEKDLQVYTYDPTVTMQEKEADEKEDDKELK